MQHAPTLTTKQGESTKSLKIALLANAVFSGMSAMSFLVLAGEITSYLNWFNPNVVRFLGMGLPLFALFVLQTASSPTLSRVRQIIVLDVAWVLASALLIALPFGTGSVGTALVAGIVASLATWQVWGLSRAGLGAGLSSFVVSTVIDAPVPSVWQVLADIGNIDRWNPGVKASRLTSEKRGRGGSRHCDLRNDSYLAEEVVVWQPEKQLTMRITATNLPFAGADIHFKLEPTPAGTRVEVKPEYRIKYGVVGEILNYVLIQKSYCKGMQALLAGLKDYVEASRNEDVC